MKPKSAYLLMAFQHTAARRRLKNGFHGLLLYLMFQHTAARRRLSVHIGFAECFI